MRQLKVLVILVLAVSFSCWQGYKLGKRRADNYYAHYMAIYYVKADVVSKPGYCRAVVMNMETDQPVELAEQPVQ